MVIFLYSIGVTIATKQPIKTPLTLALRETPKTFFEKNRQMNGYYNNISTCNYYRP